MSIETALPPLDRPSVHTGVNVEGTGPGTVRVSQEIGPRFLDHRGLATTASVGVLTDIAVGYPAGLARTLATGVRQQGVLAQLSASTAHPFPTSGLVGGEARSLHFDDSTGLSAAEIRDADGNLVLHLTGRSMVVGRVAVPEAETGSDPELAPEPFLDADVLAGTSGLDIVSGIAAETLPRGPLAGLLDLRVRTVERGSVLAALVPGGWMANPIGSIQGGVLVSIAETAASLTAQTLVDAGQTYRVLQLTVDYVRSPAVPGPEVLVRSETVRAGRRLASIETVLHAADGTVFVRAQANVQLFPLG